MKKQTLRETIFDLLSTLPKEIPTVTLKDLTDDIIRAINNKIEEKVER